MPKPVFLSLSYNQSVKYKYTVDVFNTRLNVEMVTKVSGYLHYLLLKDAVSEAYEHYNALHRDNEFIHPSAIA